MSQASWGYTDSNGPHLWASAHPHAAGKKQSPVVISGAHTRFDHSLSLRHLKTHYVIDSTKILQNTGKSAQVLIEDSHSYVNGGPLMNDYTLRQFHFHWGSTSDVGSEHKIDEKSYAAELHLVHWNSAKYTNVDEAMKAEDGLVVLAVFLEAGKEHDGLRTITDLLHKVRHVEDTVALPPRFSPASLLPDDTVHYWTYQGSLTTPPCYESVRFIIFKTPIEVSESQLESFRSLKTTCSTTIERCHEETGCCRMADNFRPTMPLHGRVIQASFKAHP